MSKFNQLAINFFENLDNMEFDQLEKYVLDTLQQHGFQETGHITFSDAGIPSGTTSRKAYYSPDLQAVAVVELSQDWDDYYNYETDQIEWQDYYHYRIYIYNHNKPFDNDDLYFLGEYEESMIFSYNRSNYNDLYVE